MIDPVVSICCLTYNHENFIAQTIESFLIQKTSFPIEILIHDDASTDNTQKIIMDYVGKFPELIKPLFQKENKYSKGERSFLGHYVFPSVRGKYIALCEGDDYWVDPLKLEKQINFLENNPDCSICFHAAHHVNEKEDFRSFIHRPFIVPKNFKFGIRTAILGGGGFMTTNSMVFVSEYLRQLPTYYYKAPVEDLPLMLFLASRGSIGYFKETMSVYRMTTEGSWSSQMVYSKEMRRKHHQGILKMFHEFNESTQFKYSFFVFLKIWKNKILYFLHG
jgi:glycosyltransferase involved in cell wall biosynthesis